MLALIILFATSIVLGTWMLKFYLKNRRIWKYVDEIPGPKGLPLLGIALQLSDPLKSYQKMIGWWEDNGKSTFKFYVGPEAHVILSTPEAIEIVLTSSKLLDKNSLYMFLDPWLGNGLLTSTGSHWHSRRKIITPAFHFSILAQFVDVFNRNAQIMVEKIGEVKENIDVDVFPFVTSASLDAICETAMGVKINAQRSDCKYANAVAEACWSLFLRMQSAHLVFEPIFQVSPEGRKFKKALAVMHGFVNKVIASRKKELSDSSAKQTWNDDMGIKKRMAFLDILLLSKDASGNNLTDKDIRDEVNTFMFEGHDTTTSATCFALYHLARNPRIQEKIIDEQRNLLGENFEKTITIREANEMNYLDRVIKESLRVTPSVPMYGRCLTEDIVLPDGKKLAKGTNINIAPALVHRNPDIFPDPERFDPDRYLPENWKGTHPFAYVPFSAGPRNCIGQKYAILEMKCFLAKIVQEYRIIECPHYKPMLTPDLVLKTSNGMIVKFIKRKSEEK